jgi:hypothetical protein
MTNGVERVQAAPLVFDLPDVAAVDGLSALAAAAVSASGGISGPALKELVFLEIYLGPRGQVLTKRIIDLKIRQNPGVIGKLEKIVSAIALKAMWDKASLNIGGK